MVGDFFYTLSVYFDAPQLNGSLCCTFTHTSIPNIIVSIQKKEKKRKDL